jgi:hypothetical protein
LQVFAFFAKAIEDRSLRQDVRKEKAKEQRSLTTPGSESLIEPRPVNEAGNARQIHLNLFSASWEAPNQSNRDAGRGDGYASKDLLQATYQKRSPWLGAHLRSSFADIFQPHMRKS